MLEKKFLESLPIPIKKWFAEAIAGMIIADGVVDEHELQFLRDFIDFLDDIDSINDLVQKVKTRTAPHLKTLNINRGLAFEMFICLAELSIIDDRLTRSEADYLRYVGGKLGFDIGFTLDIIKWTHDLMKVNRRKKSLHASARLMTEDYHTLVSYKAQ